MSDANIIDHTCEAPVFAVVAARVCDKAPARPRMLSDVVREAIRVRHYSLKTEKAYVHWIKRLVLWSGRRHPRDLGPADIEAFLSDLATTRRIDGLGGKPYHPMGAGIRPGASAAPP